MASEEDETGLHPQPHASGLKPLALSSSKIPSLARRAGVSRFYLSTVLVGGVRSSSPTAGRSLIGAAGASRKLPDRNGGLRDRWPRPTAKVRVRLRI